MKEVKEFLKEEDGVGVVEIISKGLYAIGEN